MDVTQTQGSSGPTDGNVEQQPPDVAAHGDARKRGRKPRQAVAKIPASKVTTNINRDAADDDDSERPHASNVRVTRSSSKPCPANVGPSTRQPVLEHSGTKKKRTQAPNDAAKDANINAGTSVRQANTQNVASKRQGDMQNRASKKKRGNEEPDPAPQVKFKNYCTIRCAPKSIVNIVSGMTDGMKERVDKIGFGEILKFKFDGIADRDLVMFLMDCIELDPLRIKVGGKTLILNEDVVHGAFGLPIGTCLSIQGSAALLHGFP